MTEQNNRRKQIEDQLEKVNLRMQILDMMESRLLKMRELAQRVVEEDLTEKEIQDIDDSVQELVKEVKLLDKGSTELS